MDHIPRGRAVRAHIPRGRAVRACVDVRSVGFGSLSTHGGGVRPAVFSHSAALVSSGVALSLSGCAVLCWSLILRSADVCVPMLCVVLILLVGAVVAARSRLGRSGRGPSCEPLRIRLYVSPPVRIVRCAVRTCLVARAPPCGAQVAPYGSPSCVVVGRGCVLRRCMNLPAP